MPTKKNKAPKKAPGNKWSARVTKNSDAMTLQESVFKKSPHAIALSLKRSAVAAVPFCHVDVEFPHKPRRKKSECLPARQARCCKGGITKSISPCGSGLTCTSSHCCQRGVGG